MPLHPQARLHQGPPSTFIVNAAFTMKAALAHEQGCESHG